MKLDPSTRSAAPTTWGPRGMRNPSPGAQRYNPTSEDLKTGTGRKEGGAESATGDHGSLAGLGDDDHSQYLTSYRHRGLVSGKTDTYNAAVTDYCINMDASAGAKTVNLPAAAGANQVILVIRKTDSSGNAVTVDGNGGETIDGSATRALATQYATMGIICDGSTWHRLWQF